MEELNKQPDSVGSGRFAAMKEEIAALPEHVVCVFDEAYAEYLESPPDLRPLIAEGRPVPCLATFSKIYGLAALRVGSG